MSLILRRPPALLSLAAGVAVALTAERWGAAEVGIKWPNDVWLGGAKVAGILVEGRPQEDWAVLGIGLNVATRPEQFPLELAGRATSLGLGVEALEPVLDTLLGALGVWTAAPAAAILAEVSARDVLAGRQVSWAGGSGTAAGVDAGGRLRVDTAEGPVSLDAGEVHLTLR